MPIALRRVLHIATITMVLATSTFAGDSDANNRYSITVASTLKRVFPNRRMLTTLCRTTKRIYGCTVFAEEHLSCSCERDGNRWRVVANARFVPIMFLYARRLDAVDHEQLHIDDVRTMLAEYLEHLTSREFATEERCSQEAKGVSEEMAFVRRMNDFRRKSNEKLD